MTGQRRVRQSPAEVKAAYMVATARNDGICEVCGLRDGQRHHRQGRDKFNTVPSNLMLACFICHGLIHAQVLKSLDIGHIVPDWARPDQYPLFVGGRFVLRSDVGDDRVIDDFEADRRIDGDWEGVSIHDLRGES